MEGDLTAQSVSLPPQEALRFDSRPFWLLTLNSNFKTSLNF